MLFANNDDDHFDPDWSTGEDHPEPDDNLDNWKAILLFLAVCVAIGLVGMFWQQISRW